MNHKQDDRTLPTLGVTLDRSLSYKKHIYNTKTKVATRNNLLKKLSTSKSGTNVSTINGPGALLRGVGICLPSMGKISARVHKFHRRKLELKYVLVLKKKQEYNEVQ